MTIVFCFDRIFCISNYKTGLLSKSIEKQINSSFRSWLWIIFCIIISACVNCFVLRLIVTQVRRLDPHLYLLHPPCPQPLRWHLIRPPPLTLTHLKFRRLYLLVNWLKIHYRLKIHLEMVVIQNLASFSFCGKNLLCVIFWFWRWFI